MLEQRNEPFPIFEREKADTPKVKHLPQVLQQMLLHST